MATQTYTITKDSPEAALYLKAATAASQQLAAAGIDPTNPPAWDQLTPQQQAAIAGPNSDETSLSSIARSYAQAVQSAQGGATLQSGGSIPFQVNDRTGGALGGFVNTLQQGSLASQIPYVNRVEDNLATWQDKHMPETTGALLAAMTAGAGAYGAGALGATEGTAAGTLGSAAGGGVVDYTSGAGLESVLGGGATPVAEGFSPFGPEEAAIANPGGISDYPATPTTGVPGGPAVPSAGVGGAATGAAAGTALSRILNGTATPSDYLSVAGTVGATGLGMYSANQREQTIRNELGQQRQDRAPYLAASQGWLADPNSYLSGPGQAAMGATLQGLSATHGNPIGSGTALALGNQAGLMNWQNAVTGLGNMGLSGADTRANLAMAGANAGADKWSTLAGGISDVVNPRKSLADYMREYKLITA